MRSKQSYVQLIVNNPGISYKDRIVFAVFERLVVLILNSSQYLIVSFGFYTYSVSSFQCHKSVQSLCRVYGSPLWRVEQAMYLWQAGNRQDWI